MWERRDSNPLSPKTPHLQCGTSLQRCRFPKYINLLYSEHPQKSLLFILTFNTGFEPVEPVSTPHGKSAPGLEYFTQARDRSP